jgi:hypothetical protein
MIGLDSKEVSMSRLLVWSVRGTVVALVSLAMVLSSTAAFASERAPSQVPQTGRSLLANVSFVEGLSFSPGTRVTSQSASFGHTALVGDLLVAWVSEFDGPGQVQVSDNADGPWTRVTSERFTNGGGDIALFIAQPALNLGVVTVTVSSSAATFIAGSVAHYRGIGLLGSLDSVAIAEHVANPPALVADSGPTAPVGSHELVVGGLITGGLPGAVAPGTTQGRQLVTRITDDSNSALLADVLSSNSGSQHASFTLTNPTDWYVVAAVFHPGLL